MAGKATIDSKGTMWKSIKTVSEIGVKSDHAFCFVPLIQKTYSAGCTDQPRYMKKSNSYKAELFAKQPASKYEWT